MKKNEEKEQNKINMMKKRVIAGSKFPRTKNFWYQKDTIDESERGI